ncbi:MAG: tetratricopeptide repeat protein [Candidatus Falkowbacteria bacterium]|nr:tetratricopeptide repeat protein [Candidatus Falkowbacteria bacterium]
MKFNFLANRLEGGFKNPTSFWLKSWRPFALLLLLGVILYSQTLFFDFSYLDDNNLILDNAQILSKANLGDIFSNDVFFSNQKFYYRPIMTLSLWVDFKLMEALPFWYHLSNIIFHVISAGLLFIFLQRLRLRRTLAWWASVVFLVHPVLSSAVAWVPGRNDILLTIFILASWLFFEAWLRRETWGAWLGHALFFALALFTKETAIFLPILILVYLFLFRNFSLKEIFKRPTDSSLPTDSGSATHNNYSALELETGGPKESETEAGESPGTLDPAINLDALTAKPLINNQTKKIIILVSTWLTALLVWFLPRSIVLENTDFNIFNLLGSIIKSWPAIFLYLGKIVLPLNLSVFPTLADSNWGPGLGVLVLLVVAFIRWSPRPRRNYLIFGLAWFLLFLLPSFINPNPSAPSGFFEHRLYLPLIGFMIVFLELDFIKNLNFKATKTRIGLGVLIFIFIVLTLNQSHIFRDRFAFWSGAVNMSPHSAFAHSNLGAMYYLSGDLPGAINQYQDALFLNNQEPMAHNNLGLVYLDQKKYPAAEKEFNLELAYNPNYDKALFNLGRLYYLQKRYLEAAYYWQATLVVNPAYYEAYQYLLLLRNKIE